MKRLVELSLIGDAALHSPSASVLFYKMDPSSFRGAGSIINRAFAICHESLYHRGLAPKESPCYEVRKFVIAQDVYEMETNVGHVLGGGAARLYGRKRNYLRPR